MDVPVKPTLKIPRVVVLDNDGTTGSYELVFSIIKYLQEEGSDLDEDDLEQIFRRLAFQMLRYKLFRPYLPKFIQALDFLKIENYLDSVVMYTNQVEQIAYNPYGSFKHLIFNIPYSISFLIYIISGTNIFDDIISRHSFLHGINHCILPKSFSRIFALDKLWKKDTSNIVFIDDNACPEFITSSPDTAVNPESYYRVAPYKMPLDSEAMNTILRNIFTGLHMKDDAYSKIQSNYQFYSGGAKPGPETDDETFARLRVAVLEKYACV